jgi:hypothetical protein
MRATFFVLMITVLFSLATFGEDQDQNGQVPEGNTACTFGDGGQLSVRYPEVPHEKTKLPLGKVWTPGNRPMYLFSQTQLDFGAIKVSPGAYSLYVIPRQETWTLVINSNVEQGSAYDPSKDVARLEAQTGKLSNSSDRLKLYFGRLSPTTCTLRIDYGKERAFADFVHK